MKSIFVLFFFVELPNRDSCDLEGGSEGLHPVLERPEQGNYRGQTRPTPKTKRSLPGPLNHCMCMGALSGGWDYCRIFHGICLKLSSFTNKCFSAFWKIEREGKDKHW